uniref:Uncharacterized protein n=1 Tax=Rhizophora mucronata TaxID=61149 RepID=A0A2P2P5F5_RHIMU
MCTVCLFVTDCKANSVM